MVEDPAGVDRLELFRRVRSMLASGVDVTGAGGPVLGRRGDAGSTRATARFSVLPGGRPPTKRPRDRAPHRARTGRRRDLPRHRGRRIPKPAHRAGTPYGRWHLPAAGTAVKGGWSPTSAPAGRTVGEQLPVVLSSRISAHGHKWSSNRLIQPSHSTWCGEIGMVTPATTRSPDRLPDARPPDPSSPAGSQQLDPGSKFIGRWGLLHNDQASAWNSSAQPLSIYGN